MAATVRMQPFFGIACIGFDLLTAALAILAGWQSRQDQAVAAVILISAGVLFLICGLALTRGRLGAWLAAVWLHGGAMAGLWWARMSLSAKVIDPADDGTLVLYAAVLLPLALVVSLGMVVARRIAIDRAAAAARGVSAEPKP